MKSPILIFRHVADHFIGHGLENSNHVINVSSESVIPESAREEFSELENNSKKIVDRLFGTVCRKSFRDSAQGWKIIEKKMCKNDNTRRGSIEMWGMCLQFNLSSKHLACETTSPE